MGEQKKNSQKYESWRDKLVLYDVSVRFLKSVQNKPYCVDSIFWQNLKSAYLEQYALKNDGMKKKKKIFIDEKSKNENCWNCVVVGAELRILENINRSNTRYCKRFTNSVSCNT